MVDFLTSGAVQQMLEVLQSKRLEGDLEKLVAQGLRGKPMDVAVGILKMLERATPILARTLKRTARTLLGMPAEKLAAIIGSAPDAAAKPGRPAVAKLARVCKTLSPARQKALAIQGRYMGLLRKYTGKQRAQIKSLARTQGTQAAIKLMSAKSTVAKPSAAKKSTAKKLSVKKPAAKKPVPATSKPAE